MSKSNYPKLSQPIKIGNLTLKNRVFLSAMTRNRAPYAVPTSDHVEYYSQRSGGGLLVTEGIFITPLGAEWPHAPGIWSAEQVEAWKKVTQAVHDRDSAIFSQLWHIGRVAHPLLQAGQPALSPSGIPAKGGKFRHLEGEPGYVSDPQPVEDPWAIIEQYRIAAENAKKANFDGVELHAANGYLPHQFLEAHSNTRTDEWGGSAEKRAKFILETVKVLIEAVGDSKKVGIKLSPGGGYNDMGDVEEVLIEEYTYLLKELDKFNLGYVVLCRYLPGFDSTGRGTKIDVLTKLGPLVKNAVLIGNGDFTPQEAEEYIAQGKVAAVQFGRPFIINPDLAERIFNGYPLNQEYDYATFYYPPKGEPLAVGYTTFEPFAPTSGNKSATKAISRKSIDFKFNRAIRKLFEKIRS